MATFEGQLFLKEVGVGEWLLLRGSSKGGRSATLLRGGKIIV